MKKEILILFFSMFFLSGCSLNTPVSSQQGGVLKSQDGGKNWEAKNKINETENISGADILSMAIDSAGKIYLGTKTSGIFVSRDGAESWGKINFPPTNVYGLAVDSNDPNIIYAGGVWGGRGKIYKTENGGGEWKEIYTEAGDGTAISALAVNKYNSQTNYFGTSAGAIFKSSDGGQTWQNLYSATGHVSKIIFDSADANIIYFLVFNRGIARTKDGGASFQYSGDPDSQILKNEKERGITELAADPNKSGTVYLGTAGGIFRSANFGESFEELNILASSKKFPVRAITVSPGNSSRIIYNSAKTIYISEDGGKNWSTFQLDTDKFVGAIKFNPQNPNEVYVGLRK